MDEPKQYKKLTKLLIILAVIQVLFLVLIIILHIMFARNCCCCGSRYNVKANSITGLTIGKVDVTLNDIYIEPDRISPCEEISKTVSVTNNADSREVYIRVKIEKSWELPDDFDGPEPDPDLIIINFTNKDDWINIGDYYYYKNVLPAGSDEPDPDDRTTSTLFESYMLDEKVSNTYAGIKGYIRVYAEAIQSSAILEGWGIDPDSFN